MADTEKENKFIEKLFFKLFELLEGLRIDIQAIAKSSTQDTNSIEKAVGSFSDRVNAISLKLDNRPCILDDLIEESNCQIDKCNQCAMDKLEGSNKRLTYVLGGLILLIFLAIVGTLAGLGIFVAQYEEILQIILKLLGG